MSANIKTRTCLVETVGRGYSSIRDSRLASRVSRLASRVSRLACRVSVRRSRAPLVRRGADELHTHVRLQEVDVQALDAARLESLVGAERMARFEEAADAAQASLA